MATPTAEAGNSAPGEKSSVDFFPTKEEVFDFDFRRIWDDEMGESFELLQTEKNVRLIIDPAVGWWGTFESYAKIVQRYLQQNKVLERLNIDVVEGKAFNEYLNDPNKGSLRKLLDAFSGLKEIDKNGHVKLFVTPLKYMKGCKEIENLTGSWPEE